MTRIPLTYFAALQLCMLTAAHGADRLWDGGDPFSNNWNSSYFFNIFSGLNWNPNANPVAGDSLFFAGTEQTANNNNYATGTNFTGLTFNSGAASFTLGGNGIALGGNVTNNSTNLQTIDLALALSSTRTFNAAAGSLKINGIISGAGGITKTGSQTLTLSAANTYTGLTTVSGGRLIVDTTGRINSTSGITIAGGALTYNSTTALSKAVTFSGTGGKLGGSGTITPAVTVTSGNTYSPGAEGDPGTQALTGGIAFQTGSIFTWDLDAGTANTVSTTNQGTYDKVTGNGTGTAIFNIVLGQNHFTDAFWDTNKSWTNIFSGTDPLFTLFSGGDGSSTVASNGLVAGQGQFSYTGGTLAWSAVPEPTSALAGLLLAAGLMRRKRR